jgi:GTP 3',8-cyclase / cyclic pyranopterin monophosphate synthase
MSSSLTHFIVLDLRKLRSSTGLPYLPPSVFQRSEHRLQMRNFCTKLTHVDESGKATMVNVIDKKESKRIAISRGIVDVGPEIAKLIAGNLMKKGDVLTIAQIAGIMAAKNTSNLIPLTHNIPLSSVKVTVKLNEQLHRVEIQASVECFGKTGVEIEALTAVSIAALTVYDMCKAVSHDITIGDIQLVEKRGGKADFRRN